MPIAFFHTPPVHVATLAGYRHVMASSTRQAIAGADVGVVARALLAGAAGLRVDTGVPELSSPRLDLQAAVAALATMTVNQDCA